MFPKGPRFQPPKIPDVPGPNTYNLIQESQLDAYKRGAFLEKTHRFSKEKPSDVPGPGTYNTEMNRTAATKPTSVKPTMDNDRYATLQRKVEDLERVHAEGKKFHQAEVDRLKFDLARLQKTTADQSERLDRHKKQNEALESRIAEYKKTTTADQIELKDLRVKLRMSEHEKGQMAGKQGEVGETKKALQALELKRREEVRDRDRKIADMEKALAGEKKRREGVEVRLAEIKGKGDGEVQEVKMRAKELEELAEEARGEVREVKAELAALEVESSDEREQLVVQLEQNRELLTRVAEEYGRLASSSVQLAKHSRVKRDRAALEIQVLRLERKLANAEGQVVELVSLLRHTKEENMFLRGCLRGAEAEAEWCWENLKGDLLEAAATMDLGVASIEEEIRDAADKVKDVRILGSESSCEIYRLTSEALLFHYSVLDKEICTRESQEATLSNDLFDAQTTRDAAVSDLEAIRAEHGTAQQRIAEMAVALAESGAKVELLRGTLDEVEARMREEGSETKAELKREREIAQKLAAKMQQNKVAEDTLRAEIEQLTAELTEAERYQTAYYRLVDEVGELVARNALAEDEADKLSRFNAEILGHNNPAQRIMYVDRIRRELADTKQKLLMSTRDRDVVVAGNEELRHELDMYKSVMIPMENKPRTNIIRIDRVPLADQNINVSVSAAKSTKGTGHFGKSVGGGVSGPKLVIEADLGEMTLDEIM